MGAGFENSGKIQKQQFSGNPFLVAFCLVFDGLL